LSASKRYVEIKPCNHFTHWEENDFKGVVDLVRNQAIFGMKKKVWEQLEIVPIPKIMIMK
jgi:hypothetical protein